MGKGSQCGFLLRVRVHAGVVMGMLREVDKIGGMVIVGRRSETVSGLSGVSSSWGYGTAIASAARAPMIIARRMLVSTFFCFCRDDDLATRLVIANVCTGAVGLFCLSHFSI
jgi:hypothetical protein